MFGRNPEGGVPEEVMLEHLGSKTTEPVEPITASQETADVVPNPGRRNALKLLGLGAAGIALERAASTFGLGVESEAEAKPKLPAAKIETAKPTAEQEKAKEVFLQSNVLEKEMEGTVVGHEKAFKKDLERVKSNEKVINWVVQYGDSKRMKGKFEKVLSDENYRKQVKGYIDQYCRMFNVPFSLAYGVAAHEGHFNMASKSSEGASGIFQIMPDNAASKDYQASATASELENNIYGGVKLLREMFDLYHQWSIALMGYCQGNNRFEKNLLRRTKKKREAKESWPEFLKHNNMDVLKLYSKKIKGGYGLGTQHPFQYPFYILSMIGTGTKIMNGEYNMENLPPICTNEEVRLKFAADSSVLNRSAAKLCSQFDKDTPAYKKCCGQKRTELLRTYNHR